MAPLGTLRKRSWFFTNDVPSSAFMLSVSLILLIVLWNFERTAVVLHLQVAAFCFALQIVLHFARAYYLSATRRCDVLYLWAFGDRQEHGPLGREIDFGDLYIALLRGMLPTQRTMVHGVSKALRPFLDLVALAPPPTSDESEYQADNKWPDTPYLFRSANDEWQESVKEVLAQCDAVVIECSTITESLLWELGQVAKTIPLDRILLVCEEHDFVAAKELGRKLVQLSYKGVRKPSKKERLAIITRSAGRKGMKQFVKAVRAWAYSFRRQDRKKFIRNFLVFFKRTALGLPFLMVLLVFFGNAFVATCRLLFWCIAQVF